MRDAQFRRDLMNGVCRCFVCCGPTDAIRAWCTIVERDTNRRATRVVTTCDSAYCLDRAKQMGEANAAA